MKRRFTNLFRLSALGWVATLGIEMAQNAPTTMSRITIWHLAMRAADGWR